MKKNKGVKKLLYIFIIGFMFMISATNVNALDADYGLYCGYKNSEGEIYYFIYSGFHKDDRFNIDQNFDLLNIAIEAGRPGETVQNETEIKWLQEKGILNSNGDFVCPTNPFGTNLGSAFESECGASGCHIYDIPDNYETYTCNYKGIDSKKDLIMTYTYDQNGMKWDVTYPDGTSKTYINNEINGNLMPGKECNDVYYSNNKKKIQTISKVGKYEVGIYQKCKDYSDLEHFCNNGSCKIKNASCKEMISKYEASESYGECPYELKPIIKFIKLVVFNTIQIFVPILLILLGSIDLAKAVMASDEKLMKDAMNAFIRRIILAVLLFFITTIVIVVMNMFAKVPAVGAQNDWKACWFD